MSKKEIIIEKAIELFATEGYESTSIQKLAEFCGVSQGLLYRHFKNKNDLLQHLLMMGIGQIVQTLQPYTNAELNFTQAFQKHIKLTCKLVEENRLLWKVLHSIRHNEVLMKEFNLQIDIRDTIVKPISKKLAKEGAKDAEMIAWLIFGSIDGLVAIYLIHPDVYPLHKMEKFLLQKSELYATKIKQ